MKIIVAFAVLFLVPILIVGGSYWSSANYGNSMEQLIKHTYEDNQNIYAQYGQKIAETAQVPDMYRDDVVKVVTAAIQGRYGAGGTQAVFSAIREDNPKLDPRLYIQIQEVIESGRNDFQSAQTRLIDQRRQYETALGNVWGGTFLKMAGYPKIRLGDYKPVTTDLAEEVFRNSKEHGPLTLRKVGN